MDIVFPKIFKNFCLILCRVKKQSLFCVSDAYNIVMNNNYALEKRLNELDIDLHTRFTNTVLAIQQILNNYQLIFPDFTDHTVLHSLSVIDFCNQIIDKQLDKLNADEIYCLLLGCYFHDTGMGITLSDYEEFSKNIDFGNYFTTHSKDDLPEVIRSFHNEFFGQFIKKYARFFEFPSEEHLFAIVQISRGHRKTNLLDEKEYPLNLKAPNGNTICLPYLSALIRLADEIDVTAARNSHAIYDISKIKGEINVIEFMKHDAITGLDINEKDFVVHVKTDDNNLFDKLKTVTEKMQKTLNQCREAVSKNTGFEITQELVRIQRD